MTLAEINQIDLANPSREEVAKLLLLAVGYIRLTQAVKKANHPALNKVQQEMEELIKDSTKALLSLLPKESPY